MKKLSFLILFIWSLHCLAQNSIVLQPDAAAGKDARIFNLDALANYGNDVDFIASQLDYSGEPGTTRSIIDFDFSLPKGAVVVDARLSLYYNHESETPGHIGDNAAYLRRLIVEWDEATVAWSQQPAYTTENEVLIPASTFPDQDYLDINVTALVKDMVDHPNTSHGFIFMLQNEEFDGKSMKFYSSDATVADKRPKLVITWSTNVATREINTIPISVSPNPFNDNLTIEGFSGTYHLDVLAVDGNILANETVTSIGDRIDLQLGHLQPGLYFIRLKDNDKIYLGKAIKTN